MNRSRVFWKIVVKLQRSNGLKKKVVLWGLVSLQWNLLKLLPKQLRKMDKICWVVLLKSILMPKLTPVEEVVAVAVEVAVHVVEVVETDGVEVVAVELAVEVVGEDFKESLIFTL